MVPMTLISCRARPGTRVESTTKKVWTMVSTWVARRCGTGSSRSGRPWTNSVRSRGDRGLAGRHAEDHLDFGVRLEGLRHPAAPERVEPGDEDAASHRLSRTRRCGARAASRRWSPACAMRMLLGLFHDPALRVPLLAARHVERHRVEDAELELGGEVHRPRRGGRRASMFAVTGQVRHPEEPCQGGEAEDDGHRLLGTHHGDGDRPGPRPAWRSRRTRRGRSAAAGTGPRRSWRGPWSPRGRRARAGPGRAEVAGRCRGGPATPPTRAHIVPNHGTLAEEEVGHAVDGPAELLLDAVHDDRARPRVWLRRGWPTSSAPPVLGIFSRPSHSTRNQLLVQGGEQPAGDGAGVLGASPLVHIRQSGARERACRRNGGAGPARRVARAGVLPCRRSRGHGTRRRERGPLAASRPTGLVAAARYGRAAPTSPTYQIGSNSTTVPVWAAWMIVSAP